jgi:bifunctional N-acetylglucosamine-1-phosphate-uridyltransferase/glucosamine-1-phosphate-acetyltransferase GlmU-like protein
LSLDNPLPLLVVPAAGTGSRLGGAVPKFLAPVLGRPMIDWLLELYAAHVTHAVIVVSPAHADAAARRTWPAGMQVDIRMQARPTGMLDAVLAAEDIAADSQASRIWVTWCDQIAIAPATLATLERLTMSDPDAGLVLPTIRRANPYIHFERDGRGRIVRVRQRREGEAMPAVGESDAGLFAFSREAFLDLLPQYAAAVAPGAGTGERNLLPFVPWLAAQRPVVTFPCSADIEAVGINTPEERALVERHLSARTPA